MVIGSNTVQAAINQVDARTGRKFTAKPLFLMNGGAAGLRQVPGKALHVHQNHGAQEA
jgi:hypothetical protein